MTDRIQQPPEPLDTTTGGGDDPPSAEDIRAAFLKLCDTIGGLMTKAGRHEEAAQVAAAAMGVAMPQPKVDA